MIGLLDERESSSPSDELEEITGIKTGNSEPPGDPTLRRLLPDFYPTRRRGRRGLRNRDARQPQRRAAQPARAGDHRRQTCCGTAVIGHGSGERRPVRADRGGRQRVGRGRQRHSADAGSHARDRAGGPERLPADHPLAAHFDVYQWLTVLQEYLVAGADGAPMILMADRMNSHHRRRGHPRRPLPAAGSRRVAGRRVGLRRHRRADTAGDRRRGRLPGRRARHPGDRSAGPGQQRAVRRRGTARRRQRLRSGGRRRRHALAGGTRSWRGDGWRRGADRAGRGDLRSAGRRLGLPADGRIRLRRRARRGRRADVPSARSAPGWGRGPACSRAVSARRRRRCRPA